MLKTLSRVGNSKALILDKTMLELMGVENDQVELQIEGNRLTVTPVVDTARREEIDQSSQKMIARFGAAYRYLANP